MTVRVGVIGAGLMGSRRAASVSANPRSRLVAVADIKSERARDLASKYSARATDDWRQVIDDPEIDAVAVCTVNSQLSPITIAALKASKHVLCEKPFGRNAEEAAAMAAAPRKSGQVLKVGFNLRFHPAIREAHRLCHEGAIGPLFFIRAVYGHGGRPGYAQEWRGDPEVAGGGELLDQGVHLLDLARWFLGDFERALGLTAQWFWQTAGPLEDNAFMLLRNAAGQIADLHTSWTQWRNRFSFEVFGRDGYARVEGLGGSYGPQTLALARRLPDSRPPEEEVRIFPEADPSLEADWADFLDAVEKGRPVEASAEDGLAVMRLVQALYESSASNPVGYPLVR